MIIKNANVFTENQTFSKENIHIQNGVFCTPFTYSGSDIIDASGLYAIPGLVDIHFHGCNGYDFCDGTQEAIQAIADYESANGTTTIVPASMTYDKERLETIFQAAADFPNKKGSRLAGINMEGPFISLEKKGAQNPAYIHKPDVDFFLDLQKTAKGLIKLVDIAPEEPGAMEFIKALKDQVTISLAHTTADYDTAHEAFESGACHVTHLYNAMPPFSHRAPGVIGAAAESAKHVELICDGIHIHPSVVRATFQLFGPERVVMISDSMMATGLSNGLYALGGQPVKVTGNRATLEDGTIAGSATNLLGCLRVAVKEMEIPLEQAVTATTVNPAKAVGLYDTCGSITPGKYADLLLLDADLNLKHVILRGQLLS
ncbi:MAG: N-acetylglucosamine-6-phosphate deacetylase [Lachnospiraceae bacterium]|jgi:N-acetylglucosamine-6-phosphate deacetylase|nr:N-acetylglucosamine-6-phosphate deacetylase [Lachnospiraceae bacterium]MDD3615965.1 N-acetylglucosamine-6-phosphate deacetylase [Lachnospiraceae bacterium]